MKCYDCAFALYSSSPESRQTRIVRAIENMTARPALARYHFHTQVITEKAAVVQ
jgi:hypothetical protein